MSGLRETIIYYVSDLISNDSYVTYILLSSSSLNIFTGLSKNECKTIGQ